MSILNFSELLMVERCTLFVALNDTNKSVLIGKLVRVTSTEFDKCAF